MKERLQKFLARTGVASRRRSEKMIASGVVSVNGQIVTELGVKVDPERDTVAVNGHIVKPVDHRVYILLNKPSGYLSTARDERGRPTVLDLVPKTSRVFSVGRLDLDTEGLLILTNDGKLTYQLTHPRFHVPKTYLAQVQGTPNKQQLRAFASGLQLEDGMTAPCKVKVRTQRGNTAHLEITLFEGRKRQVRRMCDKIGHPVLSLKRIAIGPIRDRNLQVGQYRYLQPDEVRVLQKYIAADSGKDEDAW